MLKEISLVVILFITTNGCYSDREYLSFIKRYTELQYPPKGLKIISINDNSENYLTSVMKIDNDKIEKFKAENVSNKIDCKDINVYMEMYEAKFHNRISKANVACFTSCNDKFWQLKIDHYGYIYLEIWY